MTRETVSPDPEARRTLARLSATLLKLHRALIQAEAKEYGPVAGPYELLSLVSKHPHFAWLDVFTKLIVSIDEARSPRGTIMPGQIEGYAATIRSIIGEHGGERHAAHDRYAILVARYGDVLSGHEELRRILADVPGDR